MTWRVAVCACLCLPCGVGAAQSVGPAAACARSSVVPIAPPEVPLPVDDTSAAPTRFSFIVYGDTRGASDGRDIQREHGKVVDAMVEAIKSHASGPDRVRFVVQSGDAVTDGRVAPQWNTSYNPLINRITTGAGVPHFAAVGNHDLTGFDPPGAADRVVGLCNYFAAYSKLIPTERSPHRLSGYPSFGFGVGNTWILIFDSTIPDDTTQYAWVKNELEHLDRHRYPNIVIVTHNPPISSGPHGGPRLEPQSETLRLFFMPLFREHHVRLVVSGHDHLFEHWVERYRDSTGAHRLDHIVSGGGGAPAYGYAGEPDLRDYLTYGVAWQLKVEHLVKPATDARRNPLHYVIVHVDGEEFRVEVIGVDRGRGFAPYDGRATIVLSDTPRGR